MPILGSNRVEKKLMPSTLAHLAYAQRLADVHPVEDTAAYLRGTIFPDIRYLGVIDRSQSHREDVTMDEVLAEAEPWKRGWLLHCWLDVLWNAYWAQFGLDPNAPTNRGLWLAVKRIEDELLLPAIFDKPGTALALAMSDAPAEALGVKAADIRRWGMMTGGQLTAFPGAHNDEALLRQLSIGLEIAAVGARRKAKLLTDAQWMERIAGCHTFLSKAWR